MQPAIKPFRTHACSAITVLCLWRSWKVTKISWNQTYDLSFPTANVRARTTGRSRPDMAVGSCHGPGKTDPIRKRDHWQQAQTRRLCGGVPATSSRPPGRRCESHMSHVIEGNRKNYIQGHWTGKSSRGDGDENVNNWIRTLWMVVKTAPGHFRINWSIIV